MPGLCRVPWIPAFAGDDGGRESLTLMRCGALIHQGYSLRGHVVGRRPTDPDSTTSRSTGVKDLVAKPDEFANPMMMFGTDPQATTQLPRIPEGIEVRVNPPKNEEDNYGALKEVAVVTPERIYRVEIITTKWPHSWGTETVPFRPDFVEATPIARIPALVTEDGVRLNESSLI